MPNSDPHAAEVRADMRIRRSQAVMSRIAAAALYLHLHRRKVQFVVKDGHVLRRQLIKAHGIADRPAAFVHEGGGLQQDDLLRSNTTFLHPSLKLLFGRGEAVHVGDDVGRHEADIMPVHRILGARIAQPDPDLHPTSPNKANPRSPEPAEGPLFSFKEKQRASTSSAQTGVSKPAIG